MQYSIAFGNGYKLVLFGQLKQYIRNYLPNLGFISPQVDIGTEGLWDCQLRLEEEYEHMHKLSQTEDKSFAIIPRPESTTSQIMQKNQCDIGIIMTRVCAF